MRWLVLALALAGCTKNGPEACDVVYFADSDGDGFGDQASSVTDQCEIPTGFVDNLEDCDDTSALVNPDAAESCNGVDDDCDGIVDLDATVGTVVLHADGDGDGYGAAVVADPVCPTVGFVEDATDCDDGNSEVSPAAAEVCNNGIDDNCDDSVGSCVDSGGGVADADGVVRTDGTDTELATAALGFSVGTSDLDGDGFSDGVVGAPFYGADAAGAVFLLWGDATGFDTALDAGNRVRGETVGGLLGYACATDLDLDGDGVDDAVVSALNTCGSGVSGSCGAVFVIGGSTTRIAGGNIATVASASMYGEANSASASVEGLGDLDGDGKDELAIGGPALGDGVATPSVFVYFGRSDLGDLETASPDTTVVGGVTSTPGLGDNGRFGAADLDGDGARDLVIGSATSDGASAYTTQAHVFYGDVASGVLSVDDADATVFGVHAESPYGSWQLAFGDVDGDGLDDTIVGVDQSSTDYRWRVHAFAGADSRPTTPYVVGDAIWSVTGGASDAALSLSVGDNDGDGAMDLLIGSPFQADTGAEGGAAYLFRGPRSGASAAADADALYTAGGEKQWLANAVDLAGDVNGDGKGDVVLGAPDALAGPGSVYLFFGVGL